jgi:uncharacterized phage protein (TIGR01671 family)
MSRVIKFRAWDKEKNRMYEFDLYEYMSMREEAQDDLISYEARESGLMQFTGLLDKNGREIYGGDIIEYNNHREVVKFIFVDERSADGGDFCGYANGESYYKKCEIIGNIYENPELIK